MISPWIANNKNSLESVKRVLLEKDLENSYAELPLLLMHQLLVGAETEVTRLQGEINNLNVKIGELEKQLPQPEGSSTSDK